MLVVGLELNGSRVRRVCLMPNDSSVREYDVLPNDLI